ncbi:MAG: UvrB/UvrC motif-containing protein [Candidatus Eisenbacteria bacterium]|nr:UvrB/UvrC motif-containing protein [Candidatus Eisenbacteria bacterium]
MTCQNCHESEATIHFKEFAQGQLREIHLCDNCAAEKGFHLVIEQNKLSIVNQFIWMAENLYPESATKVGMVQCERCGLRFSQFARTGRLGCSDCYTAFASQLPQVLRRVHGAVRHKGRTPEAVGPGDPGRQALDRLRLDLSRAIEREDFETAARLRDEIRALEPTAAQISGRGGGPASSPVSEGGTQ